MSIWKNFLGFRVWRKELCMLYEYSLSTEGQNFYNITRRVAEAVQKSGVSEGLCVVY